MSDEMPMEVWVWPIDGNIDFAADCGEPDWAGPKARYTRADVAEQRFDVDGLNADGTQAIYSVDEVEGLRARIAELEAGLKKLKRYEQRTADPCYIEIIDALLNNAEEQQ